MTPTLDTLTRRLRDDARLLMQGEIGMALGLRYHEDTLKQAAEAIESQAAALTAERARADDAVAAGWCDVCTGTGKLLTGDVCTLCEGSGAAALALTGMRYLLHAAEARAERAEQERDALRAQLTPRQDDGA